MCIRDRPKNIFTTFGVAENAGAENIAPQKSAPVNPFVYAGKVVEDGKVTVFLLDGEKSHAAVSYTHLDVYKRQLYGLGYHAVADLDGLHGALADCLADQVDGDHQRVGAVVGDHRHLGGAGEDVDADLAVQLSLIHI